MKEVLGNLIAQFREYYKSLPPIKRNSLMIVSFLSVISVLAVVLMLSKADYEVLLSNVNPDQLPRVIAELQKKNIPFKLKDNGKTILIPESLLPSTQMAIMSELGGSNIGTMGFELFAKQDFGVTSYAQRVTFQRALQGELMRSINTIEAVKQSKVILALPAKKTFLEEGGKPTASVVVELYPKRHLSEDQVRGITYLVSSAVEG
ncbi:MAG: flagellar M-ring protein FliF, partial [Bdellovibrio sp.]